MAPNRRQVTHIDRRSEPPTCDGALLENGQTKEAEWSPGKGEYAVMLTLAVISLMVALDATILVSVLPTLAIDLGGTATDAFWAGTSYLLACAVCQPFIAALSDIFGRKEMLLTSVIFFTLGTVLCAPVAKNFTVFFAGRSVQGIGGGGIITMGQVIFADIVPLRQRPKYFSLVLAAWALGSVIGPLTGGLFVEHVIWSWCFYINFPFCALGLVLVPIYVNLETKKTSMASKLARVDWMGGFLFIGGLTSFLVGISWAGIQYEWSSVQVIAPMAIGVVGVALTVLWECRCAREPFLRPSLFSSSSAIATYSCALFQGFILFCALYYVPFYFTAVRFEKPTQSGLDIFPVTCFLLPGSIVISLVTSRIGRFRWAIWSGWAITAVGCGLLVLFDEDTRTPVWAVILAVFGIGHGILLTSVNVGIQAISRVEDAGRAAAMYAFMRTLGMSIGVAVGGTVFQNVMVKKLDDLGLPEEIAHDSEAFVVKMTTMSPEDPIRIGALQAYVHGFHGVYWTVTGAACAAFVISLVIKHHSMDKILESKFVLQGSKNVQHTPSAINVAARSYAPAPRNVRGSEMMREAPRRSDRRLPDIYKASPLGDGLTTRSNAESTFSVARHCDSMSDGSDEREKDVDDTDTEGESLNERGGVDDDAGVAAVAYYVEPSGKIVPVDILSDARCGSVSESASIAEVEMSEQQPAYVWDAPAPPPAAVVAPSSRPNSQLLSPEALFDRTLSVQPQQRPVSQSEHEAVFADLTPAWMYERPVSGRYD